MITLNFYLFTAFYNYSTETTPAVSEIQSKNDEIRVYPSGNPLPHGRAPHETIPINWPRAVNGPPESPVHVPVPIPRNVQIVLSCTKRALSASRRRHSSFVIEYTDKYRRSNVAFVV